MNRKFVDSDFSKAKTWAKLLGSANLVDEFAIVGTSSSAHPRHAVRSSVGRARACELCSSK